jgi:hypothetical protein
VARTSDFVRICPRNRPRRHAFEGGRAVTVIVDVEDDTIRLPVQDVGQHMLALLDWSAAHARPWPRRCWPTSTYGVEMRPLLVATTKRLPQRTIESTLPIPGTVCPGVTFQTPLGPSNTAVPLTTSRSVQPAMVVGLVSGVGMSFVEVRTSFTMAPVKVVCRGATVESLLASRDSGAVLTDVVEAEESSDFAVLAQARSERSPRKISSS